MMKKMMIMTGWGVHSGVPNLSHTSLWVTIWRMSPQHFVQWCHIDTVKLVLVGVCTRQKLSIIINQGSVNPPTGELVVVYQHTMGYMDFSRYIIDIQQQGSSWWLKYLGNPQKWTNLRQIYPKDRNPWFSGSAARMILTNVTVMPTWPENLILFLIEPARQHH